MGIQLGKIKLNFEFVNDLDEIYNNPSANTKDNKEKAFKEFCEANGINYNTLSMEDRFAFLEQFTSGVHQLTIDKTLSDRDNEEKMINSLLYSFNQGIAVEGKGYLDVTFKNPDGTSPEIENEVKEPKKPFFLKRWIHAIFKNTFKEEFDAYDNKKKIYDNYNKKIDTLVANNSSAIKSEADNEKSIAAHIDSCKKQLERNNQIPEAKNDFKLTNAIYNMVAKTNHINDSFKDNALYFSADYETDKITGNKLDLNLFKAKTDKEFSHREQLFATLNRLPSRLSLARIMMISQGFDIDEVLNDTPALADKKNEVGLKLVNDLENKNYEPIMDAYLKAYDKLKDYKLPNLEDSSSILKNASKLQGMFSLFLDGGQIINKEMTREYYKEKGEPEKAEQIIAAKQLYSEKSQILKTFNNISKSILDGPYFKDYGTSMTSSVNENKFHIAYVSFDHINSNRFTLSEASLQDIDGNKWMMDQLSEEHKIIAEKEKNPSIVAIKANKLFKEFEDQIIEKPVKVDLSNEFKKNKEKTKIVEDDKNKVRTINKEANK